jgi:branched-chain amino acid transport system ATP-binding protein
LIILEIQNVHTYYGDSYVLQGVSLEVGKGSVVAVLGRNGVGKTTLIRSVMGFTPPQRGKILYQGQDISHQDPFRISRLGISLVPQGRRLCPSLTTRENLTIAARKRGNSYWSLDRVLGLLPHIRSRLETRAGRLSGGEQQMVALGRALVANSDLILMDEPTEGLAPLIVNEVGKVINEAKQRGVSVLLVEQNLPFALKVADYTYVMSKGVIVYESTQRELEENAVIKLRYLGV